MRIDHPRARRTVALGLTAGALAATLAGCSGAADAQPDTPRTGSTSSSSSGSTTSGPSGAAGIGDWPSFLPSQPGSAMATGSVEQPAMSYPGAPVLVRLGSAAMRVDLDGPSYPASTKVGADQVPCTFTLTLSGATATIDLRSAHLDVLTHDGAVHPLKAGAGTTWPTSIAPGVKTVVRLQATLPSGEGFVRLYPRGGQAAAGWDYVAETD